MNQISGTTPTDAPAQAQDESQPEAPPATAEPSGFGSRGRARRRARFLRRARELAYRDLGGLVYNLHRFGQRNDALVLAKLSTLGQIDAQLRGLESALQEREPVTVLREAGITACRRCAAIHSSEDRFCPNCGLAMSRNADLPIAAPAPAASPPAAQSPAPAPAPMPAAAGAGSPVAPPASGTARSPVSARPTGSMSARSPKPPAQATPAQDASAAETDSSAASGQGEPTEILRPGAPGP